MRNKGQVTIFIILAIFIVILVALVIIFWDDLFKRQFPSEINPVYNTFKQCLEEDVALGINVLESQGGYIYLPKYEVGSEYMPFSSQLDFLGNPIPYWYYISGNNLVRTQVPSIDDMEKELAKFIELKSRDCFFDDYYDQGYGIEMGKPIADIIIKDKEVVLDLEMNFVVSKDDETYIAKNHEITVDSELGSLYESAKQVYEKEQEELFLEDYGIDVLRLYAPVDGVDLSCSPKVWNAPKIFEDLKEAIQANTLALKGTDNKKEYFDVEIDDLPSNQRVRFLNSANWTYSFEVNPSDGPIMIANPVGNQQGMGIIGFCYVTYHFVYSIRYPVLVQVISGNGADEIFQFPMAVVIERNKERNASGGEVIEVAYEELCKDKNTVMNIKVYDSTLKPLESQVSYSCLGTTCNIGTAENGMLSEEFPQCVHGFINIKAEGYKDESIMYSTVNEGSLSIYLTKLYNLSVQLKIDNQNYNKEAVIEFVSPDYSKTIFYPEQKSVDLAEGEYEIKVQVYKNSSLQLGTTTQQHCVKMPRSSIGGILGLTKTECYDVQIPSQVISNALSGGGQVNYTFSESELKRGKIIDIYAKSLPNPNTLEQVQTNYILFEDAELGINVR
ncbi:MAG: hypothetical protein ACP5NZ_03545 [Nanobdellota archaeon]